MLSLDANLLLYALNEACPEHARARAFLEGLDGHDDVALSEFILLEFYVLLRNPAVLEKPLSEADAAAVIQSYRRHPRWMLLGYAADSQRIHDRLWKLAATVPFPRRRIFDARTALTLIRQGVTEFATANTKDFEAFDFARVWNPLGG